MRRTMSLLGGFVVFCFPFLLASPASAHHLTVTANASCVDGSAVISYTATSWLTNDPTGGSDNPQINILFNGDVVDSEPFVSPTDSFSGTKPAPSDTNVVTVEGVAVADWSDGYGGGQTSSVDVTIPSNCNPGTGRFTGGGKAVYVGNAIVTKGFEVDCDLHQPSNNLEINWTDQYNGSHHFHMLTFDSALCTYDGNPVPPKAKVNTIVGSGTGRYDGTLGYTVEFTLIDNGEPGRYDESAFMIYETADPTNVVLAVPLMTITSGNIQAHVDQK